MQIGVHNIGLKVSNLARTLQKFWLLVKQISINDLARVLARHVVIIVI